MKDNNGKDFIASLIEALKDENKEKFDEVAEGSQERQDSVKEERQKDTEHFIKYLSKAELSEYKPNRERGESIKDKIDATRKTLENRAFAQNMSMKVITLIALLLFLLAETALIFFYTWCQATNWWSFNLEEWSFRLLVGATITQITAMLIIAVKHLFPNHN